MEKVLVLDSNDYSTLTACRSLGQRGIKITVATISNNPTKLRSRYAQKQIILPSPYVNAAACSNALVEAVTNENYDLVIPLSDSACQVTQFCRHTVEARCAVALPSANTHIFAYDKERLMLRCQELDIPTPTSTVIRTLSDAEILLDNGLLFPVYLKPIHNAAIVNNHLHTYSVKKVDTPNEMIDYLRQHLYTVPIMVQEAVSGYGVGIYFLADQGRVVSMVQQRHLHEPNGNGDSSYRIAVPIDPALAKYTRRLISSIGWNGVAMVEFRGQSDHWAIMGLNGHYWGSLALTVATGLDFPYWEYCHHKGQQIPKIAPRLGCRQRHLGKDLRWLWSRCKDKNSVSAASKECSRWLWEARHLLLGRERFDVESFRDPLPALQYWTTTPQSACRRIINKGLNMYQWHLYHKKEKQLVQEIITLLKTKQLNILFVCMGNICRSPFAEIYLKETCNYENVRSTGLLTMAGRMAPSEAEAVAHTDYGIDLSKHRSSALSDTDLQWAELILVFDKDNYIEIQNRCLKGSPYCCLLGSFDSSGEINDPYGNNKEAYQATYQQITHAINSFSESLSV